MPSDLTILTELPQEELNLWIWEFYVHSYDRFLLRAFAREHVPTDAMRVVYERIRSLQLSLQIKAQIEQRIEIAVAVLIQRLAAQANPDAAVLYELMESVRELQMSEPFHLLLHLADSKHLQSLDLKGVSLHFLLLKVLAQIGAYCVQSPRHSRLEPSLMLLFDINLRDPAYAAISYRGLWQIDKSMGWQRIAHLLDAAIRGGNVDLELEVQRFLQRSRPQDLLSHFNAIYYDFLFLRLRHTKEEVRLYSNRSDIDTPFKVFVDLLNRIGDYAIWPSPDLGERPWSDKDALHSYIIYIYDPTGFILAVDRTDEIVQHEDFYDVFDTPNAQFVLRVRKNLTPQLINPNEPTPLAFPIGGISRETSRQVLGRVEALREAP